MKIKKCRNCKGLNLLKLFSLGNLCYTGKFLKNKNKNIKKTELGLVMCSKCRLVQLNRNYNLKYLYGPDYGYRTGINKTMREHMQKIQKILKKKTKLTKGDYVLDIASNDGTLLNFYKKNIFTVGIDPIIKKYKKYYKNINFKIADFFPASKNFNLENNKFKIITALSVFYDASDPNSFLKKVNNILDGDGIFMLEHADMLSILKVRMFDTICHEHLYYYSSKIIINMCKNNGLRVFDLKKNDINGGSTQYFICKKNAKYSDNYKIINKVLSEEKKMGIEIQNTYTKFFKKIKKIKFKTKEVLNKIIANKKIIHGYGASTKGNVLMQYFNINKKYIKFIADRNPNKFNHYTPGTMIKIISEKKSRKLMPDYYFVLPWHFKNEILKREKKIRKKGCRFIFPLPKPKII